MKKKSSHLDNRYKAIFMPEPLEAEGDRGYLSSIPHILKELYIDLTYQQFMLGKTNMIAFDLGAHIGLWSMYASRYCKKIYAVEPSSVMVGVLKKNLEWNGVKNVEVLQVAIANNNTKANLFKGVQNSTSNLLKGQGETEPVECWTLEKLFKETKVDYVDFVKMDIEGAEFGVIGGDYFDKVKDKIGMIVGELHKWADRDYNQFKWALKKRGFEVEFPRHKADLFIARRKK